MLDDPLRRLPARVQISRLVRFKWVMSLRWPLLIVEDKVMADRGQPSTKRLRVPYIHHLVVAVVKDDRRGKVGHPGFDRRNSDSGAVKVD